MLLLGLAPKFTRSAGFVVCCALRRRDLPVKRNTAHSEVSWTSTITSTTQDGSLTPSDPTLAFPP